MQNPLAAVRLRWASWLLACVAVASAAHAESTVHIKLATLAPKGSLYHRVLQDIGAAVKASEGPGAAVTIYTDGSQGGEADVVRRMRVGQLNGALISLIGLAQIDESVSVLQKMPLLFRSTEEVEYVGRAMHPDMERRLADKGFVVVMWAEAGWVRYFSKEAFAVPADLKSHRIFAWAGDPEQVEIMKRLGYRPVVLETADIIPGLETGLIDTVPLTPMWALATQVDGLAPHMVDVPWAPIAVALVLAKPVWDGMTAATHAAVHKAAVHAVDELRSYQQRADGEAVAAMEKRGLKVVRPTAEQERAWRALAEQIHPLLRGYTVPAPAYDTALKLLAEYRARPPAAPPAQR